MSNMARFSEVAALAGDPARAVMLHALMDGRALTAGELARAASIAPQTASGHLARLTASGVMVVEQAGRHRYYRLAGPAVARMIEGIMQVASDVHLPAKPMTVGPRDQKLRAARTCYDHLAGRLGVALTDAMVGRGFVELSGDAGLLTNRGLKFLGDAGIDMTESLERRTRKSGRVLCRPCLDWSERRPHLAGTLGAAICGSALANAWVRRLPGTRALQITPKGAGIFRETFRATLS